MAWNGKDGRGRAGCYWERCSHMNIGEWINNWYPYNGILNNKEKLIADTCNNMYKSQHYVYLKNSDPKEHKLLIPYI